MFKNNTWSLSSILNGEYSVSHIACGLFKTYILNIADSATVLMQNIMNVAVLVEVTHGKGIQQEEI